MHSNSPVTMGWNPFSPHCFYSITSASHLPCLSWFNFLKVLKGKLSYICILVVVHVAESADDIMCLSTFHVCVCFMNMVQKVGYRKDV